MSYNPQAIELNNTIEETNPHVTAMLSQRGKGIFFPKKGILAQSAAAAGKEINATIGSALEEDGTTMSLPSIASQINLPKGQVFPYAPSPGKPEIRAKWKEMLFIKNPSLTGNAISLPIVTGALTHGLSMSGYLFMDKGDVVISPDLYWENYELLFEHAYGAKLRTFPTFKNKGFNVEGLKKALMRGVPGKRIVVLNFPNNPTGYTPTVAEALAIKEVLVDAANKGNSLVVLIDDAYFGLVFEEGITTESIFGSLANAHERLLAVKLDGPTKEDYVWGFRVGFVTFGISRNSPALFAALEAKLAGAIRGNISNISNLSQSILMKAYSSPTYNAERQEKFDLLKNRYSTIKGIFAKHPEYRKVFTALPYNSGYFMCIQPKGIDAEALQQLLLDKYSTGVISMHGIIRIAFSSTPANMLEKLFSNLYSACCELKQN